MEYDHKKIESKWQKKWLDEGAFAADQNNGKTTYLLVEFPYPSGDGLHVGHVRPYTGLDVIARKRRMQGENVLFPMGWDAFGLPTENFAIKTGIHPREVTKTNTDNFRKQIQSLGVSFDWDREINTTDPDYYKWTQWIFLQLYKDGLAYKDRATINWCLSCKVGLANEEVIEGQCERCGGDTEKRDKEQWMLAITKYAERLHDDLDSVDYLERVKLGQKNWIGKSHGAELRFAISGSDEEIDVFTTRPDTLFGATYMVLAPEHELITKLQDKISNIDEVRTYIQKTSQKTEIERTNEEKEKTGVELQGIKAVNPATKEEVPIYIADYVLGGYGTGAIMAVPAHDVRDYAFAKKYNIPIQYVVEPITGSPQENPEPKGKIVAIVERDGEVLTIHWKPELGGRLFVGGTAEEGEDPVETAKREIAEETGYTDLELIERAPEQVHHEYFAHSKNKAFVAKTTVLHFKLKTAAKQEVRLEEDEIGKFEVEWVPFEKAEAEVSDPLHMYAFKRFIRNEAYGGEGYLINSGKFNGMETEKARSAITKEVGGEEKTTFKLRDWVFSRQRYWGEPIPMIHCEKDGWVPVPESDLPVKLPEVSKYEPTDDGESPLSAVTDWVNTTCPVCDGAAKRETDTMPNWAGSSWYYLRYTDPNNTERFASEEALKKWSPVDWYNGGMEHTTLHLLYSRFWHKFLFDKGLVPTNEPYQKRTSHGLVLAEGGEKMSKSKGNVINPNDVVEKVGADTLRLYEMFMGPFEQAIPWSTDNMVGARRFLERVWRAQEYIVENHTNEECERALHQAIKKVTEDIEEMKFNTAVSSLMVYLNVIEEQKVVREEEYSKLLQLLSPFAPHITSELWEMRGYEGEVYSSKWPEYDESKLTASTVTIVVQINGKVKASFEAPRDAGKDEILKTALEQEKVKKIISSQNMAKTIHIPNKLINIVV